MQQKPTLLLMKGLPCSGKTEWALRWVAGKHNRVRVSWTDILKSIGRKSRDRRLLAFETAIHLMLQALKNGFDVVLDECNLSGYAVGLFIARAQMAGADIEWHTMDISAEEGKRRNAAAGHPVEDMEIDRLAKVYDLWLKQQG